MSSRAKFRYLWQAGVAYVFYYIVRLLPIPAASALGGLIGRMIGWRHKGSLHAQQNLNLILPERAVEHKKIIRGMWDNFGRVLAEYPHLQRMWDEGYIEVVGRENLPEEPGRVVFVAAHLGNWEVAPMLAAQLEWELATIYRPLNNIYLDPLLRRMRAFGTQKLLPKSAEGGMELMRHVRSGGAAGVLVDQRLSNGINVPFFGYPSMTAPLPAALAVKFGARLLPARVERLRGAHLRVTLYPILDMPKGDSKDAQIESLTITLNNLFEDWIRVRPDQWLWSHRRWRMKKDKTTAHI